MNSNHIATFLCILMKWIQPTHTLTQLKFIFFKGDIVASHFSSRDDNVFFSIMMLHWTIDLILNFIIRRMLKIRRWALHNEVTHLKKKTSKYIRKSDKQRQYYSTAPSIHFSNRILGWKQRSNVKSSRSSKFKLKDTTWSNSW